MTEISLLIIAAVLYYSITRLAWSSVRPVPVSDTDPSRPASPRVPESRENKRNPSVVTASLIKKDEAGFVWMTVPKNYRSVHLGDASPLRSHPDSLGIAQMMAS